MATLPPRRVRLARLPVRAAGVVVLGVAWLFPSCDTPADPTPSPPTATCGNAVVESPEECDDGNAQNADGCLVTCQKPVTWVPGDVHVHSTGCGPYTSPEELVAMLKGQGLQVASSLVWGQGFHDDARLFTGRDHPASEPGFILHYDMEVSAFPAAKTGHLVLLGLDSLQFSGDVFARPGTGVPVVDWARRQPRAVIGMAHGQYWPDDGSFPELPGGCCVPWEVVVNAVRGRLDFLSLERLPPGQGPVDAGTFRLWKALQNAGVRVAIAAGSDWGCLTWVFGGDTPRTDVVLDGALSYETWLAGIKAGRTAVATGFGNHLNVRVEGRGLGQEVALASPREVTVTIEKEGAEPADVEILLNGEVAHRLTVGAGPQVAQVRLPVSKSAWVSARSAHVVTSPVYVLVGGLPIRSSASDVCYLWRSVEDLEDLVSSRQLRITDSREEALRAYAEAAAELQRRFVESGGQSCP